MRRRPSDFSPLIILALFYLLIGGGLFSDASWILAALPLDARQGADQSSLAVSVRPLEAGRVVRIGEVVELEVILLYPEGMPAPVLDKHFPANVALLAEQLVHQENAGGKVREQRRLRLAFFEAGQLTTGPIRYTTGVGAAALTGEAPAVTVNIQSILTGPENTPAPAQPPYVVADPRLKILKVAAIGLGLTLWLAGGLWWWLWRRRGRTVRSDFQKALANLQALRSEDETTLDRQREGYFAASAVVKWFIGREGELPAAERTTAELRELLPELAWLSGEALEQILAFLTEADRVKFALCPPAGLERFIAEAGEIVTRVHEEKTAADVAAGRPLPGKVS